MIEIQQELMTPNEAAKWFRRSVSWLRRQPALLRVAGPGGQPLFHVGVCRAYVLAQMAGVGEDQIRAFQLRALAAAAGVPAECAAGVLAERAGVCGAESVATAPPTGIHAA